MTITSFDKPAVKALRDEVNQALLALAEKHGISLAVGNATFALDGSGGTFKLNFAVGAGKTNRDLRLDKFAIELESVLTLSYKDLKADATYRINGANYKLVGYNRRAHQYPFIGQQVGTDKKYKFSIEQVREARVIA